MNNTKVVLYIAMSLDGYIARPDGAVDWLASVEGDGGDNGYAKFYDSVGTVIMGRLTYEEVLKLSDVFPYQGKPCYILSRSEQLPSPHVIFTDENISELISRVKPSSEGDIWLVGGGQMVGAFLEKNILDKIQVAIIPTVIGEGIPLFPPGMVETSLKMTGVETLGQIVSIHYDVVKNQA